MIHSPYADSNVLITHKLNNTNMFLVLNIQSFVESCHANAASNGVCLRGIAV